MKRSIRLSTGFLVLICLASGGCGLFGPDFTELKRDTYRLEQNGTEAHGRATVGCSYGYGGVRLSFWKDDSEIMSIYSKRLASAEAGESLTPDDARYTLKGTYSYNRGEIEIRKTEDGYLEGIFSFKMDLVPSGGFFPLVDPQTTVEGGFNVSQLSGRSCVHHESRMQATFNPTSLPPPRSFTQKRPRRTFSFKADYSQSSHVISRSRVGVVSSK